MRKLTKATYRTANVLLPLSETTRILRAIKYSGEKLAEQARRLTPTTQGSSDERLSFDEVVRESGQSLDALISRYLWAKRIWLLLLCAATLCALMLPTAMFLSDTPFSGVLLCRILSLSFMLAGFGGLMFVRALKNQYHLWQLQSRQLGTFTDWKATSPWLRDIFSWQLRSRNPSRR